MLRNKGEFMQSRPAAFDGLFDWDFIDEVLPGPVALADTDAVLERRGRLLKWETKSNERGYFTRPSKGQSGTIRSDIKNQVGRCMYLLHDKKPDNITNYAVIGANSAGSIWAYINHDCDYTAIREFVSLWWDAAGNKRMQDVIDHIKATCSQVSESEVLTPW